MQIERAGSGLHEHIEDVVLREFPDRDLRIVDVGCGTGAFLQRLVRRRYMDLQGIDISPPVLPGPVRFHAVDLDGGRVPIADAACDLAILIEFIEHVENPGQLLAELRRIVKPGGCLLLTTPNLQSLEARLRWLLAGRLKQFDEIGDPTHITPIHLFPFLRLCERHGFRARRSWGHPVDGASPTSRPSLRALAGFTRMLGLRASIRGDHLCILLEHQGEPEAAQALTKSEQLTRHYAGTGAGLTP